MKFFLLILSMISINKNFDIFQSEQRTNNFLKSGSQFGYFYNDEFWDWLEEVRHTGQNSQYLTAPFEYGRSYEKRPLKAFYITADTSKIEQELPKKNMLLFTALHHSREPLTLTMVMLMVIEILKNLQSEKHNRFHELIRDNVILFLPVVNIDSYIFINNNWNDPQIGKKAMMIRKNRNIENYCSKFTGGVDLNRNYSFKFALDESGSSSNPCSEDFRGRSPFSEPETKSIKDLVESHPNIVSGVNIHSYGNDWIYPFNYVHDGSNSLLKRTKRLYYNFYNEFKRDIQRQDPSAVFGNAAFTLDYATNGEAGDWLTGAENILNIDIELGNKNRKSNSFYPPRNLIDKIVRFNWVTMKEFLYRHIVDFKLKKVIFHKNKKSVDFFIMNKALSGLNEFNAGFELIFKANKKSQKPFQLMYTIEELPNYQNKLQRVNKDIISSKFPGRHVLLLRISFSSQEDFDNFQDLKMIIERNDNFRNYPEQEFTFKTAQYKKNQLSFEFINYLSKSNKFFEFRQLEKQT